MINKYMIEHWMHPICSYYPDTFFSWITSSPMQFCAIKVVSKNRVLHLKMIPFVMVIKSNSTCFHACANNFVNSWWRHQMETFFASLATCAGYSPVTREFPAHKGQWRGALMVSLIWSWTNGWLNNRDACDLRRHRAHYDIIVMYKQYS